MNSKSIKFKEIFAHFERVSCLYFISKTVIGFCLASEVKKSTTLKQLKNEEDEYRNKRI